MPATARYPFRIAPSALGVPASVLAHRSARRPHQRFFRVSRTADFLAHYQPLLWPAFSPLAATGETTTNLGLSGASSAGPSKEKAICLGAAPKGAVMVWPLASPASMRLRRTSNARFSGLRRAHFAIFGYASGVLRCSAVRAPLGAKGHPCSSPRANPSFEGTAEKLRFSVPSALRAPAAPQLKR